jgi:hypothetical protein
MVGGRVIGIARGKDDTLLHVRDNRYKTDVCAVRCVERRAETGQSVEIAVGDEVWWQCGQVMWTPRSAKVNYDPGVGCGTLWDIVLPKVGYSHSMGHLPEFVDTV